MFVLCVREIMVSHNMQQTQQYISGHFFVVKSLGSTGITGKNFEVSLQAPVRKHADIIDSDQSQ